MKKILLTQRGSTPHWVGDGFLVRSIFSYADLAKTMSPFLLMDYAGPTVFPATEQRKGVDEHPHRGFETVTIVYSGEVEHRDSAGGGGLIKEGDVQWMSAASGLVHEEKHGEDFAKKGGRFEMIQLWVNLPKKDKMKKPRYQALAKEKIPTVELKEGIVRVIAGNFQGTSGLAETHTRVNLWDMRLKAGGEFLFKVPSGDTAALFVLEGKIKMGGKEMGEAELAVLDPVGDSVALSVSEDAKLLFLGGEVINETIAGYGPFVMNTYQEINEAMRDYQNGKMGTLR